MKHPPRPFRASFTALALVLAGLTMLAACPGCATLGGPPAILTIQAQSPDQFVVEGKVVEKDRLVRALRRAGAREETEILVQVAPGTPGTAMLPVYAVLRKAGYLKVLFTGPRETTATVSESKSKALTPSPKKVRHP